ncbi:Auxin-induced protein 10A5 [Hibiscus syriacus]|uniref:Auxin-induced protein 10A5 n=1 Tax=Hibiscus syriacus TaxID=106335 RepID=A0A6A2Z9T5_HIBSY|nr:Auxin-induced protein 10A5 [Hibiscus syriacus]
MDDRGDGGKVTGIRQIVRLKEIIQKCPEPPPDVPKGYLAVYVGAEVRRFIIPTSYLTHPVFKILLQKAEEEFRYDHNGGLTLPCKIETFKYLLKCIENHPKGYIVESSVSEQVDARFYAE